MVSQFATTEPVTAVIHLDVHGGEAYSGPLVIGYYAGGGGEIWIEQDGHRVQIPAEHFKAFIREVRRAHQIAAEAEEPSHG